MNKLDWDSGLLLETSQRYWTSCALHAAVKLDVFTSIDGESLEASEIARRLETDTRGLTRLLDALTAMGLLEKSDNEYSNTTAGTTFLSKNSPQYVGHIIMHHHHLMDSWSRLDLAVKAGCPVRERSSFGSEKVRESFLMGMFNMAMNIAPRIVSAIDLSDRRHLLDLGGGPGTYAIHFCLSNPELRATVFDLPTTRPFAEKTIEKFGLSDRIDFKDGDFVEEDIEGVYDIAWLSHILHAEGFEVCRRIVEKTVSALEPGGMIIVHDFILNDTMDGPLFPALFSLNMLLGTRDGQSYSEGQIMNILAGAGVDNIKRIPIESLNDSGIVTGLKSPASVT
ncbi:MAG: methyltransferase [Candidatus Glassbacteria bacterium]